MGLAGTAYGSRRRECFQDRMIYLFYKLHSGFIGFPDRPWEPGRPKFASSIWSALRAIRLLRQHGARPSGSLFRGR